MATLRSLTKPKELFYLVFFHVDQRVSVVSEKMLREKDKLDVEDSCHVRVGKKEYDGRVVARGTKDGMLIAEEQYLDGIEESIVQLDDDVDVPRTSDNLSQGKKCTKKGVKRKKMKGNKENISPKKRKSSLGCQTSTIKILSAAQPIYQPPASHGVSPATPNIPVQSPTAIPNIQSPITPAVVPSIQPPVTPTAVPVQPCITPLASVSNIQPPITPTAVPNIQPITPTAIPSIQPSPTTPIVSIQSFDDDLLYNDIVDDISPLPPEIPINDPLKETTSSLTKRMEKVEEHLLKLTQELSALRSALLPTSPKSTPSSTSTSSHHLPPEAIHLTPPTNTTSTPSHRSLQTDSTLSTTEPCHLLQPDEVISKYPNLITKNTIGRLAVRLAVESYFGKELLMKCTVFGFRNKDSLPKEKVLALKQKLLSLFPQYLSCPLEFEPLWSKCVGAINHSSAKMRSVVPIVIN